MTVPWMISKHNYPYLNILWPRQKGKKCSQHFEIQFLEWRPLYQPSLKFIPKGPIDNKLAVREITKSSSTFSANVIIWFLHLHDINQIKSNYTWINYNHDDIAIWCHIMIYDNAYNLIFATKFGNIYLAKGEKCSFFRLSFVNLQRVKDGTHVFDAKYRYMFAV